MTPTTKYQDMPIADELKKALADLKFISPTDIQEKSIPPAIQGLDLMACAETGSGKTAAYGVPLVNQLLEDHMKRALILAPTRELVHQISDFLRELTAHAPKLRVTSIVGGADMRKQLNALKKKPRIIVATPGRLTDHLMRKSITLKTTEVLVLDEGDRMLDMGFAPQLDAILKYLPEERQTSLFTATLPEKVQKLARKYLKKNTAKIDVDRAARPVSTIKQSVIQVKFQDKDNRLIDELNQRQGSVIVFARTKHRTDIITRILQDYGFSVELIHGGRTQGQRNKAIQNFKKGSKRILCATDIAARGIDIPQVEHVINFDLPMMDEDYVHRIGRTARNGATGEAVSFVTPEEHRSWQALTRKYKIQGVELQGVETLQKKGKGKKKRNPLSKRAEKAETPKRDRWRKSKKKTERKRASDGKSEGSSPAQKAFKKKSFKKKSSGFKKKASKRFSSGRAKNA